MASDTDAVLAVRQFELDPVVRAARRVARAWSNEVWQVTTTRGDYVIKLFPIHMTAGQRRQLEDGIAFESLVLETGQVPVPQPVSSSPGWLIELDTAAGPRLARCHEWVAGTPATTPLPLPLLQAAGAHLGYMHALDQPGGDTGQLPAFDVDRWQRVVRAANRKGAPHGPARWLV